MTAVNVDAEFKFITKMLLLTFLTIIKVIFAKCDNDTNIDDELNAADMADNLISALGVNAENNIRLQELREKVNKIDSYIIDRVIYNELLKNITADTNLNETNFYKALMEDDKFKFLTEDEPKSVYLKMKEKMNRDDIIKILADRSNVKEVAKSARKMMGGKVRTLHDTAVIDEVVDKIIAETPRDDHTFDVKANDSKYWDPQAELNDIKEYHEHNARRLYKGVRTTIKNYPFMVSIHIMGRFWCGGVIYWHDLILTSASCLQLMHNNRFFRENPKILQVRIGSNHSRIGGEVVDALEVYFHPGYNPRTLKDNLAVIRLRRHLFFDYHRIPKTIAISHNTLGVPNTAEVVLLGWGVTKVTQKLSYEPIFLQKKVLPIYPNLFCKEVYGDKFVKETMFCAGTLTTGEGACDHDAGGPAMLSGTLVGIISFGPSLCGFPNAPTVFTLVGAFADWIETVNETMPSYYRGKKGTSTTPAQPFLKYFETFKPFQKGNPINKVVTGLKGLKGEDATIPQLKKDDDANLPVRPTTPATSEAPRMRNREAQKGQEPEEVFASQSSWSDEIPDAD